MEWTALQELIKPELGIVLAACWIVGYVLKQTPHVPNWSIVYIVTAVAILAVCLTLGWTAASVLQGVLCGAVAVYGYQLVKQAREGAEKDASQEQQ